MPALPFEFIGHSSRFFHEKSHWGTASRQRGKSCEPKIRHALLGREEDSNRVIVNLC